MKLVFEEVERNDTADHITYWYDRHTKSWIVQVIDKDGFEIESIYSGNKTSRDYEISMLMEKYHINIKNN